MANSVTIAFVAKRDHYAGGYGYRVPTLTERHVSVAERDTLGILFMSSLQNVEVTTARLRRYAGLRLPGVVFESSPDGWEIEPQGSGYMARVKITRPLERAGVTA